MYVYPITFTDADGSTINGELVTDVTLTSQDWTIEPAPNGVEYSGYPAGNPSVPTWTATLPNLLNQNTSLSINILTTYVNPTSGVTLALNGTLPTGWSFNTGTNLLTYNGTSVAGPATVSFTATLTGPNTTSTSNNFSVSGAGSATSDVTAPTIPLAISATGVTQNAATLGGYASSDPAPAGPTWSGMKQYNVAVTGAAGSPFTVTSAAGNQPTVTLMDIGAPSPATTFGQSGADVTITTYGSSLYSTIADSAGFPSQQLTGTSWLITAKVSGFVGAVTYSLFGLMARVSSATNSMFVAAISEESGQPNGMFLRSRAAAGATTTDANPGITSISTVTLALTRSGDTYTGYYSSDGINFTGLGSVTQVMGATVYVGGFACTSDPTTSVTCDFTQLNIQTNAPWSLNLTGLSANTNYPVSVTAQDVAGNVSSSSATFSFTTLTSGGGGGGGANPFPRFGVQSYVGSPQLPTSSTIQGLAQYPWILLGLGGAVGGGSLTRDQMVSGLKGQTLSGKNAVKPIVGQYDDGTIQYTYARPGWTTVTNNNNWLLRSTWPGGGIVGGNYIDPVHSNIAVDHATGLWPFQYLAKYMHDRYIANGSLNDENFANWGSVNLDFVYLDNMAGYLFATGDWQRNGGSEGFNNVAGCTAVSAAKADAGTYWQTLDTTHLLSANTGYAYTTNTPGGLGLTAAAANMYGLYAWPMQQFVFGVAVNSGGAPSVMSQGGFANAMAWYKAQIKSSSNSTCVLPGAFTITDVASLRHDMCFTCMDNGYFIPGNYAQGGSGDGVAGGNASTWPGIDEFWGGSLVTGGFLGAPATTSFGAVQTTAWSNGVWRRDFVNGGTNYIVLINSTNSSATVTLPAGTWYHLSTRYGESINNQAGVSGSFTLNTINYVGSVTRGDACILSSVQPPT